MKFFKKYHNNRNKLKYLVVALAAIVIFTTTYALVLPAITMETTEAETTPGIVLHEDSAGKAADASETKAAAQEAESKAEQTKAAEKETDASGADARDSAQESKENPAGTETGMKEDPAEAEKKTKENSAGSESGSKEDSTEAENGSKEDSTEAENGSKEDPAKSENETKDHANQAEQEEKSAKEIKENAAKEQGESPAMTFEAEIKKTGAEETADGLVKEEKTASEAEAGLIEEGQKTPEAAENLAEDNSRAEGLSEENRKVEEKTADSQRSDAQDENLSKIILKVKAEAEEGTFPAGTTMKVKEMAGDQKVQDVISDAVDGTVKKMQAVDISFYNKEGKEIEPSKDIKVTITSDTIQSEKKENNEDPVIVHIPDKGKPEIIKAIDETNLPATEKPTDAEVVFENDAFSVYAVVYTVDFHYEVNGKMYDFSIPGGGFVSLEHLVEVLGIAESGENGATDDVGGVAEDTSCVSDAAIGLNQVEVSEAAKKFVADVESVEFSTPSLVDVSKVEADTTVGAIKDARGLEVEYSADLTEEQIAEINNSTVEAGDWALISVRAFTSEESLTVRMKNGDVFTVKVTDASGIVKSEDTINGTYFIVTNSNGTNYALAVDGSYVEMAYDADTGLYSYDGNKNIEWKITPSYGNYYHVVGVGTSTYLTPYKWRYVAGGGLTYSQAGEIEFNKNGSEYIIKNATNTPVTTGIYLGWNPLGGNNPGFVQKEVNGACNIKLVKSGEKPIPKTYTVNYTVNNTMGGSLSGKILADDGKTVNEISEVSSFSNQTKSVAGETTKQLNYKVTATPYSGYRFLRWEDSKGNTVTTNQDLPATTTVSSDNETFKAIFEQIVDTSTGNYPTKPIDPSEIEDWRAQYDSDDTLGYTNKTAEVYDYENRIYRVDLTASSGVQVIASDVQLAFVTDVSNSMLFPAGLTEISSNEITINNWNRYVAEHQLSTDTTYYTIGDKKGTSTVYALFHDDQFSRDSVLKNDKYNGWYYMDASYYAKWRAGIYTTNVMLYGQANPKINQRIFPLDSNVNKLHNSDDSSSTYKIYLPNTNYEAGILNENDLFSKANSNATDSTRLYYLKSSMKSALTDLLSISSKWPAGSVYAGLERFAQASEVEFVFSESNGKKGKFIQIGGANGNQSTYEANKGQIDTGLSAITTYDGTAQDAALTKAKDFNWNASANTKKYIIFISDGAPNIKDSSGKTMSSEDAYNAVINAANNLGDDITLITIGLSVDDVELGKKVLHNIATEDPEYADYNSTKSNIDDKKTLYYQAKNANDLTVILQDIVRSLMVGVTMEGSIIDKIDQAFYPVDEKGNPLQAGDYIGKDGKKWTNNSEGPKGKIGYDSTAKCWTVTWDDQEFKYSEDASVPGWHGTVLVKSKEDFLGGNTISTNKAATISCNKFKVTSPTAEYDIPTGRTNEYSFSTPHVNVDELSITQESTTWTVYLGTDVDPKKELKQFFDDIKVNEVVTSNTDDKRRSGDMLYDLSVSASDGRTQNGKTAAQFSLKSVIGELSDDDWKKLIEGETLSIPYAAYDHSPGVITLALSQIVAEDEKDLTTSPHQTSVTGQVEKYTLTAEYLPNSAGNEDYHVGDWGTANSGPEAMEIISTNEHTINVFAKGFQITKTNEDYTKVLTGAKFILYRTARNDAEKSSSDAITISGNKYVPAATLDTSSNGIATMNPLEQLASGEKYYLVETKAPAGYNMMSSPIEVQLNITDTYTPKPGATSQTTKPASGIYDWTETATLTFVGSGFKRVTASGEDVTNGGVRADSESETLYYQIMNNPGYELPSTGGPGTTLFTILGSILVMISGIGLILWRRRRNMA